MHNDISGSVRGNVIQSRSATVNLDSSPPVAVAGLPPQPIFVGRAPELAKLMDALRPDSGSPTVVVSTVSGLAGVGKTALAIHAAHRLIATDAFPGGVLMINLRGYDQPAERVTASAALASLLGALGIRGEHIPSNQDDRARLWRSVLANHEPLLIVADNASSANQVQPLLPGNPTHRVLVTSRHRLTELDGARLLDLDVLTLDDAVLMLTEELAANDPDDDRVHTALPDARRVIDLCGALPLAVRVAAAQLAAERDQSLADLAAALTDRQHRLEELDYHGSIAVRAAFDLSYTNLEPQSARLFRLMALNPGPEFGAEAAAALLDVDISVARRVIRALRRANLVQPSGGRERWRLHDLLHLYAEERVANDPERDSACERLLEFYGSTAAAANEHFVDPPRVSGHNRFHTRSDALQWIDTERANIVSAVGVAAETGYHVRAVNLALDLHEYFDLRKHWADWISVHEQALGSAQAIGKRDSEALLLISVGSAYRQIGDLNQALASQLRALAICRAIGARDLEGFALERIGQVYSYLGRFAEAVQHNEAALQVLRETGNHNRASSALYNLAVTHRMMGEFQKALEYHQEELAHCRENGALLSEGRILDTMGIVYREMGRFDEAIDHHRQNLAICRKFNDEFGEARTIGRLGVTYRAAGEFDKALNCHQQALAVFRETDAKGEEADTLYSLGYTYQRLGQPTEAVRHWEMALAVITTLPGIHAARSATELRRLLA